MNKSMSKPTILIGIDPGVNTGLAAYNTKEGTLTKVCSMGIVQAMEFVYGQSIRYPFADVKVRIEDARKRVWFGNAGREKLQGAGSVKRDCSVWEEFCTYHRLAFEMVAPKANKTKLDADKFRKLTKWKERTNQHARDAAMLVFGR
jgi:hypothetical protein